MTTRLLLFLFLGVYSLVSYAQVNYNQTTHVVNANSFWAWYNENGLDFSSGSPVHTPTAFQPLGGEFYGEGVSSISDPYTGSLLFYTDGRRIFDKTHNIMPNGDNLAGNFHGNSVQGSCIVPVIGNPDLYYVFSMGYLIGDQGNNQRGTNRIFYSIVDITLNGNDGDVVSGSKNIPLDTSMLFNEAMLAVPGNNCNIWLLTHKFGDNTYHAYEITQSGVNHTPVVSTGVYKSLNESYHLSVSPDRSKVMMTVAIPSFWSDYVLGEGKLYSELMKFDPNTGVLSEGISIEPQFSGSWVPSSIEGKELFSFYTSAFSPNGQFLYLAQQCITDSFGYYPNMIVQLDISQHDSASIASSFSVLETIFTEGFSNEYRFPVKSFNDQIYLFYNKSDTIGRIRYPDLKGGASELNGGYIRLPSGYINEAELISVPNEIVYALSYHELVVMDSTALCGAEMTLSPSNQLPGLSYIWNTGSTDSALHILPQGSSIYWVHYYHLENNCIHMYTDTFIVHAGGTEVEPEITIEVDTLSTSFPFVTYQWMLDGSLIPGATDARYVIQANGDYQVIVSDENGCVDTSEVYRVTNHLGISLLPGAKRISVYPNPSSDKIYIDANEPVRYSLYSANGQVIENDAKGNIIEISHLSSGVYLLKVVFEKERQVRYATFTKLNR